MKKLFSITAGLSLLFLSAGAASADANVKANAKAQLLSSGAPVAITTPTGIVIFPGSTLRGVVYPPLGSKGQAPAAPLKPSKPAAPTTFTEPAPPAPSEPIPM